MLDHTYLGDAYRLAPPPPSCAWERISGAFKVLYQDDAVAIVDNGETGEAHGRWLILSPAAERVHGAPLELAA